MMATMFFKKMSVVAVLVQIFASLIVFIILFYYLTDVYVVAVSKPSLLQQSCSSWQAR
jgi:hypothetical protein